MGEREVPTRQYVQNCEPARQSTLARCDTITVESSTTDMNSPESRDRKSMEDWPDALKNLYFTNDDNTSTGSCDCERSGAGYVKFRYKMLGAGIFAMLFAAAFGGCLYTLVNESKVKYERWRAMRAIVDPWSNNSSSILGNTKPAAASILDENFTISAAMLLNLTTVSPMSLSSVEITNNLTLSIESKTSEILIPLVRKHREKRSRCNTDKKLKSSKRKKRNCNLEQINSIQEQLHNLLNEMGKISYQLNELKNTNNNNYERSESRSVEATRLTNNPFFQQPLPKLSSAEPSHLTSSAFLSQSSQQTWPNFPICFFGPNHAAMVAPLQQFFQSPQATATLQQQTQQQQQQISQPQPPQTVFYSSLIPVQHRSSATNSVANGNVPITCMYLAPPPSSNARSDDNNMSRHRVEITTLEPYQGLRNASELGLNDTVWQFDDEGEIKVLNGTTFKTEAGLFNPNLTYRMKEWLARTLGFNYTTTKSEIQVETSTSKNLSAGNRSDSATKVEANETLWQADDEVENKVKVLNLTSPKAEAGMLKSNPLSHYYEFLGITQASEKTTEPPRERTTVEFGTTTAVSNASSTTRVRDGARSASDGTCDADHVVCGDGVQCVRRELWCDGEVHCRDTSDEATCSCRQRLNPVRLCDGFVDCPDGSDELECLGKSSLQISVMRAPGTIF